MYGILVQKRLSFDELAGIVGTTTYKAAAIIFGHARPSRAEQKKLAGALGIDHEHLRQELGDFWLDK